MTALKDLAQVIRSKNAGPFEITLDVLFDDPAVYERVRGSNVLTRERLATLYHAADEDITYCDFFAPALAFKCTIIRRGDQGGIGERDTFGTQQHAPLLDIEIPDTPGRKATPLTSPSAPLAVTLAREVERLTLQDIPPAVRATAREHLLDALGTAIAASTMDFGEAIHRAGGALGSGQESHAIAFGTPLPAPSAALVNGTLIHGLDFDDTHIGAIYHPTAPALAAALATAEAAEASGEALLLAFIVGVEVGCRLAAAGAYKFHARGFHPTAICGTFAAACVSAKLRGLSAETLTSALGLCGSQAAGILELHQSWLKRMHPGWAAHAGLCAVTMAAAGFRGPATVFEGTAGLYRSHLEEIPSAEDLGLHDIGQHWMTAEVALKPYPCCHFTHAFVDASFAVLDELGRDRLSPDEVTEIVCPTALGLRPIVVEPLESRRAPTTIYDALFSIPFVTARALATRRVDVAAFYDEPLDNPDVLALAAKVSCPEDPDADFPVHFPGEVRVTLTDGRVIAKRVATSYGTSDWPMRTADIAAKFAANAGRRLSAAQVERLTALVDDLEQLPDIRTLVQATS